MIAAGLHGVEQGLEPGPAVSGDGYASDAPRLPDDLGDRPGAVPRQRGRRVAFGEDVVGHYARAAEIEIEAYRAAVTDWERIRAMSASEPRPRPLIGICAAFERAAWSFWDQDAALVADSYLGAVRGQAGGLPVVLAPEPLDEARTSSRSAPGSTACC